MSADLRTSLEAWLPQSFVTEIASFGDIAEGGFTCTLRANVESETDWIAWLQEFSDASLTNWNIRRSSRVLSRARFTQNYGCRRSSRNKSKLHPTGLNTDCQAKMAVRIKNVTVDTRKKDRFIKKGLCAVIELIWNHNHALDDADALSRRPINPAAKRQFFEYFAQGMRPRAALTATQRELSQRPDADIKLADSSFNPRPNVVYHLYNLWRSLRQVSISNSSSDHFPSTRSRKKHEPENSNTENEEEDGIDFSHSIKIEPMEADEGTPCSSCPAAEIEGYHAVDCGIIKTTEACSEESFPQEIPSDDALNDDDNLAFERFNGAFVALKQKVVQVWSPEVKSAVSRFEETVSGINTAEDLVLFLTSFQSNH